MIRYFKYFSNNFIQETDTFRYKWGCNLMSKLYISVFRRKNGERIHELRTSSYISEGLISEDNDI